MEITMEQASQLAEMKLNRMNRDYQNCISSTRVAPQTPLPDSKSAAKDEDDIQAKLFGFFKLLCIMIKR